MSRAWHDLRVWVREKELLELRDGQAPVLSPAQREAIAALVSSARSPPATPASWGQGSSAPGSAPASSPRNGPVVDPDFNRDTNWVADLNHHFQSIYQPLPDFYYSSREPLPRAGVKWVPECTVPHLDATFPNENYGFRNGEAPCFSTKKDAKQYTAMYIMRCIGGILTPPTRDTMPQVPASERVESSNGVRLTPNGGSPSSDTSHLAYRHELLDNEPVATQQVKLLCNSMNMVPPQFEVKTVHDGTAKRFNARAIFQNMSTLEVPGDLGTTKGAWSSKDAKEESAKEVLEWLTERRQRRQEELNAILA